MTQRVERGSGLPETGGGAGDWSPYCDDMTPRLRHVLIEFQDLLPRIGPELPNVRPTLLFILFDYLRRPNLCHVWIQSSAAKGSALPKEIPALIQFNFAFASF